MRSTPLYACVCHAVTTDQVRACAGGGFRHVVGATRAGSGCGSCVSRLRALLEQPHDQTGGAEPASVRSVA